MILDTWLGLIKKKGESYTLSPERFCQMEIRQLMIQDLITKRMIGYSVYNGVYWIVCKQMDTFFRVPFASNTKWFEALTSMVELSNIAKLDQIYITGLS